MELKNRKHVYIISLVLLVFLESYFCRKISSGELPSSLEDPQEISTNKGIFISIIVLKALMQVH